MKNFNVPVALNTIAWMVFGAIAGAEAIYIAYGVHGGEAILLGLMNYALFMCIWAVGYGMGAHETKEIMEKDNDDSIPETNQP